MAERLNSPLSKVLYMPIGKGWLFRRGAEPVSVDAIELEEYEEMMEIYRDFIITEDMLDEFEFDSDMCYTDIDQLCKEVGLSS